MSTEQFRETEDGVHGRADLVAHIGQKLALGGVGSFGGYFALLSRFSRLIGLLAGGFGRQFRLLQLLDRRFDFGLGFLGRLSGLLFLSVNLLPQLLCLALAPADHGSGHECPGCQPTGRRSSWGHNPGVGVPREVYFQLDQGWCGVIEGLVDILHAKGVPARHRHPIHGVGAAAFAPSRFL